MNSKEFRAQFQPLLGGTPLWLKAEKLFAAYGDSFSQDIAGVLEFAIEQNRVDDILTTLANYHKDILRGVTLKRKVNQHLNDKVRSFFKRIYQNQLEINFAEMVPAEECA